MKYASLPLLLQDINIVVVTDVHSWVAGHGRHEPKYDADYGDVLSFYQHLQRQVTASSSSSSSGKSRDVYFVMNGDFVDGTGLSAVPPSHLVPILERMPFDAVNMGNHELYHDETVEFLVYGNSSSSSSSSKNATGEGGSFIDHWDGNYLTSNTLLKSTNEPIGNRYTYLRGDGTNSPTLLTFGFLYNFQNNCPTTVVESVEGTVSERWFRDALLRRDDYDAILVLAHMDAVDSLVYVILEAIRSITDTDDVPVVFVTGHSHRRAYEVLDANAVSFEAGHFLDTVGFVSFPLPEKNDAASGGNGKSNAAATNFSSQVQHVFLDSSKARLRDALFGPVEATAPTIPGADFETPDGKALTRLIQDTRDELGLNEVLGCSPATYRLSGPIDDPRRSLWGLYLAEVVPTQLLQGNSSRIFVQRTGALRYSLMKGQVTIDDVIAVSPFEDKLWRVTDRLSGSVLYNVLSDFATAAPSNCVMLPSIGIAPLHVEIKENRNYALYVPEFHLHEMTARLQNATPGVADHPVEIANATTTSIWEEFVRKEWTEEPASQCNSSFQQHYSQPPHHRNHQIYASSNLKDSYPDNDINVIEKTMIALVMGLAVCCLVGLVYLFRCDLSAWSRGKGKARRRTTATNGGDMEEEEEEEEEAQALVEQEHRLKTNGSAAPSKTYGSV